MAYLLNATLVIPKFLYSNVWKDPRYNMFSTVVKLKSFVNTQLKLLIYLLRFILMWILKYLNSWWIYINYQNMKLQNDFPYVITFWLIYFLLLLHHSLLNNWCTCLIKKIAACLVTYTRKSISWVSWRMISVLWWNFHLIWNLWM